eukprot:NODE_2542_length_548_cov_100.598575_g2492_i0.p1 GENE.NODE_2542_length_548_cov_100.598575_g2492_i0~~NODE_2542_length_548_cov_100.598575_g2492_i0.p1  ORF type:complete len:118 (-),score=13.46 NODE_2542_length_548_cov_100.598575_g2492_i0:62-415(-)
MKKVLSQSDWRKTVCKDGIQLNATQAHEDGLKLLTSTDDAVAANVRLVNKMMCQTAPNPSTAAPTSECSPAGVSQQNTDLDRSAILANFQVIENAMSQLKKQLLPAPCNVPTADCGR